MENINEIDVSLLNKIAPKIVEEAQKLNITINTNMMDIEEEEENNEAYELYTTSMIEDVEDTYYQIVDCAIKNKQLISFSGHYTCEHSKQEYFCKHIIDEVAKEKVLIDNLVELKEVKHKVLIFSQCVSNFENLEKTLPKNRIISYKITGAVNKSQRYMLVDKFNKMRLMSC